MRSRLSPCLAFLVAGLPACSSPVSTPSSPSGPPTLAFTSSPSHASMFGEVTVTFSGDFSPLGTLESVTVNGIHALDVHATASSVSLTVQGASAPGPARVVFTSKKGTWTNDTAFSYDAPVGGAPATWASFGASLTQGFQSGGLQPHGQLMSWDAQIARSAGVYLAPPLVVPAFLPPLEPSQFVKNCDTVWNQDSIVDTLIGTITVPGTHKVDLRRARQDPTLPTRNFAVGGATVADIIQPATEPIRLIEIITELPDGDPNELFGPPVSKSQIDRLVDLDPDIAFSADLLANDSDSAVTDSDDLHPEQMTPVSVLAPELDTLAKRLGGAHGHYFIGNLLPLDGLPNVAVLRKQTIASGVETEASFDAKLATIRTVIAQYNDALAKAAAPYPNLHVIDLHTPTETVLTEGLVVGSVKLTGKEFGGLLSLDFLHFTDTGYAFLANVFVDAINGSMRLSIPKIDVAEVLAHDALSPASLAADGVHCTQP
jgi:hypothetical protein